jgi:hypothetical protein
MVILAAAHYFTNGGKRMIRHIHHKATMACLDCLLGEKKQAAFWFWNNVLFLFRPKAAAGLLRLYRKDKQDKEGRRLA